MQQRYLRTPPLTKYACRCCGRQLSRWAATVTSRIGFFGYQEHTEPPP